MTTLTDEQAIRAAQALQASSAAETGNFPGVLCEEDPENAGYCAYHHMRHSRG